MSSSICSILLGKELITVKSNACVFDCAILMAKLNIGALPVKDIETDNIIGIISERDMVRQVTAKGLDPKELMANDIVHINICVLDCHETIEKAMNIMSATRRRHMLISRDEDIISIISIGDLMNHLLDEKVGVIAHLEDYIRS